jgi:HD-GYP domain-containing protein (c-di-GMP phosphodiesterase class II)
MRLAMSRRPGRHSIFAQRLDRAVFVAYFLGAVVPLLALGWFFVYPAIEEATQMQGSQGVAGALGLMGILVSSAFLCLGSFFVLRSFTHQTLARLDADKRRLSRLVEVSNTLAEAPHAGEVARTVAEAGLVVCESRASFVFLSAEKDLPAELVDHSGADAAALYTDAQRAVDAMVKMAMDNGRPALVGNDGGKSAAGLTAAAAVPIATTSGQRGVLMVVHTERGRVFDTQHVGALSTLASMAGVAVNNADLRDTQRNFFAHMTDLLVNALDVHLDYQVGHSRRVAQLANVMGRELGFDDTQLEGLHFASLMHDVGMFRVARDQCGVPQAYQRHPLIGSRMLERIQLWEHLAPFVLHHHEWWNGEGYPGGLRGDESPLEARIIGIAEAFDSMTSANYRTPRSIDQALQEIESGAGSQFDPRLARLFIELVRDGKVRTDSA